MPGRRYLRVPSGRSIRICKLTPASSYRYDYGARDCLGRCVGTAGRVGRVIRHPETG